MPGIYVFAQLVLGNSGQINALFVVVIAQLGGAYQRFCQSQALPNMIFVAAVNQSPAVPAKVQQALPSPPKPSVFVLYVPLWTEAG